MTRPENLIHSDFMTNLGTDYLAVAANGHVVGRAATEAAVRQAVPDAAHYLSAKDLAPADGSAFDRDHDGHVGGRAKAAPEPNPVAAGLDAVKAQSGTPETDADPANPNADPEPAPRTNRQRKPAGK